MKRLALAILTIIVIESLPAQTLYSDAVKLRSLMVKKEVNISRHDSTWFFSDEDLDNDGTTDLDQVYQILKSYTLNPSSGQPGQTDKEIDSLVCTPNSFLCRYFASKPASPNSVPSRLLSAVGNLDVTAFADGLAQFLVQRTKEELNEAFFRKFSDYLNYYPEFRVLFPNTNTFTKNFNSWEYSNLTNTLRESFDKDIKTLLGNFLMLKEIDTSTACPDDETCRKRIGSVVRFFRSNEGRILLSGVAIGNGLVSDQKLPDIIDTLASDPYLIGVQFNDPVQTGNLINSIRLINILSTSLRSSAIGSSYLNADEFRNLDKDTVLRTILLGLVQQKIKSASISISINGNMVAVANHFTPANISGINAYLNDVSLQSRNITQAYNKITEDKLEGKSDLGVDYAVLFEESQKFLRAMANTQVINGNIQLSVGIREVFSYASKGLQVAHDIGVRNYNAAVVGLLKMMSDVSEMPRVRQNYPQLAVFNAALLKYGSFASNVVLSKDPTEINEAIKTFVLPSGSSSIKKHTNFSISINSYVGGVFGINNNPSQSSYTTKDKSGNDSVVYIHGGKSISVYAPLGLAFNWGLGWKKNNPWSLTGYISLIDVGAIVNYRFIEDTGNVSNKFKVSLANIFAPGGNVIIGLPNVPISIGGGMQWIPTLQRDPTSNEFYNVDHSAVRFQVFAAVDIPLVNLHTGKKSLLFSRSLVRNK